MSIFIGIIWRRLGSEVNFLLPISQSFLRKKHCALTVDKKLGLVVNFSKVFRGATISEEKILVLSDAPTR
jgi:hypothetical protein